jgi:uncharacterized protein YbbK (DUF523 family)
MALKIGISSCLLGNKCNYDGNDLLSAFVKKLSENSQIQVVSFCPEDSVFGTPRPNLRIVGGDGEDVLDGKASVVNQNGEDVTEKQIEGAQKFFHQLSKLSVNYAILMDGSPSCGTNVLLNEEDWPRGGFKRGIGVAAALLKRNNIKVFSGFDELTTAIFIKSMISEVEFPEGLRDLKDFPKFKHLFSEI